MQSSGQRQEKGKRKGKREENSANINWLWSAGCDLLERVERERERERAGKADYPLLNAYKPLCIHNRVNCERDIAVNRPITTEGADRVRERGRAYSFLS